jgi:hypothetical protein
MMLQRLARLLGLAALTVLLLGIGALILIVLLVKHPLGALMIVGGAVFVLFLLLLLYPKWRQRREGTPRPFGELRPLEPSPARRGVTDPDVAAALSEAEARLRRLATASLRLGSAQARLSLGHIVAISDRILDEIAADPRDLNRARRFLKVFLDGLTDVVERYAKAEDAGRTASLDENFLGLLREMERAADEQLTRLRHHDLEHLDVSIDVLKDRLAREGIGG